MTFPFPSPVLIVGIGVSGMSMARFLTSRGVRVLATDQDPDRREAASLLRDMGVCVEIGGHTPGMFAMAAALIPSPGVPLNQPLIQNAVSRGIPVIGDLDIFCAYNTAPVIAITGTNGKTTVTTLTRDMLTASGISNFMGGNIGTPLVDLFLQNEPVDGVVAEISSFQLDLSRTFNPRVGVLLNITHDHLDRYAGLAGYARSKWSLFSRQDATDIAVVNADIPPIADLARPDLAARVLTFSSRNPGAIHQGARIYEDRVELTGTEPEPDALIAIDCRALPGLPGIHNRENIAAAALAARCLGACPEGISRAIRSFTGLPHRITFVRELNGIRFCNDSKATNTDAVIQALGCCDGPVILILGGRGKNTDFTALVPAVRPKVRLILAIGESAEAIQQTMAGVCPVDRASDMTDAVHRGVSAGNPGDTVLLSPACASFDMYDNYKERGNDFTRIVTELRPRD